MISLNKPIDIKLAFVYKKLNNAPNQRNTIMKFNLRKAAAIQQEILQTIKTLSDFENKIEFTEFDQNIEDTFNTKHNDYLVNVKLITDLYRVYYAIRNEIAVFNQQTGISKLLNEIELAKKLMVTYTKAKETDPAMDLNTINLRLDKIRKAEQKEYYYNRSVDTTCVLSSDIKAAEQQITKLKQDIRDLSDNLLELNVQTKIILDAQQYQILVQAGICN